MTQPIPHPLRVTSTSTRDVHAARPIRAGGHNTACLTWLNPKDTRIQWLDDTATITCDKCIRRTSR